MPSHPRPELSGAEVELRRSAGLCFYCGKSGHRIVSCPDKARQVAKAAEHARVIELKKDGEGPGSSSRKRKKRGRPATKHASQHHSEQQSSSNPNLELLGKRVKLERTGPSGQRHDKVFDEDSLQLHQKPHQHHYVSLQRGHDHSPLPSAPVIKKKPLFRRQLLAQYLSGFSYPSGPQRLIHGSKLALQELELAVSREGMVLDQRTNAGNSGNDLLAALETSTEHFVRERQFPRNFFASVQGLQIRPTDTLRLGDHGPIVLDVRQVLGVLNEASGRMFCAENPKPLVYRLGIVMCSGTGLSLMRRARIIEEESTERSPGIGNRTIWLYMRVDEHSDEVKVSWCGFKHGSGGA